jgi:predicted RNase H-like HicB family nuclease
VACRGLSGIRDRSIAGSNHGAAQQGDEAELEREADGRWIAEVTDLPGGSGTYGATQDEAQSSVQTLALRVVAERLEHGEAGPQLLDIFFRAGATGPAVGPNKFSPRCYGLAGRSSAGQARIAPFHGQVGRTCICCTPRTLSRLQ